MFTKDSETLCNMHSTVMFWLREIRKSIKAKKKINSDLDVSRELSTINEALELLRKAKKAGQHMENALVKYRRSFEACGYRRFYKGEVQPKI